MEKGCKGKEFIIYHNRALHPFLLQKLHAGQKETLIHMFAINSVVAVYCLHYYRKYIGYKNNNNKNNLCTFLLLILYNNNIRNTKIIRY